LVVGHRRRDSQAARGRRDEEKKNETIDPATNNAGVTGRRLCIVDGASNACAATWPAPRSPSSASKRCPMGASPIA
jgi:hypothetical protein